MLNVECAETEMKLLVTSSAAAQNWHRKSTRNDMIMWPGQSTGICRENAGSRTGMINGTITSLRAYWKMTRTKNSFGTSVDEQTITSRLGDQI